MSLNSEDLLQIRQIIEDVFDRKIEPLMGKLEALRNDIKEIYSMIAKLERGTITDSSFQKLTLEEKLMRLNAELLAAAKQAGVTLPR